MAIATTIAAVYLLLQGAKSVMLDRVVDPEVSRPLLSVPIFIGATLAWTMVGLVLGAVYEVGDLGDGPGALGTPNILFAGGMAALGLMPVGVLSAMWWQHWRTWIALAAVFIITFGWVMPILAAQW